MKRILILALIASFGLLGNSLPAHAGYYDNMTVNITSNPPADANGNVYAKVGDTIEFTRHTSVEVGVGTTHWLYSPFVLDCDSGDPTIKCTVIGKSDSKMEFSMNVMTDWTPEKSTYQTFSANNIINIHVADSSGSSTNATVKTTASVSRVSVGKPDLTITASKALTVKRKVNGVLKSQYKIGVTVSNKSRGDAVGDIYYSLNDNTPILISKGGLAFGKSKKVFIYVDVTEKGKSYVFTVDPGNTIDELKEDNNTATRVVGK